MTPSSEVALLASGDIRDGYIVLRTRPKCFARTINSSTREMHQELTILRTALFANSAPLLAGAWKTLVAT